MVEELLELGDDLLLVHVLALELDRRLLDHVLGGEDRRVGPDRERDRVRRARVDLDLGAVLLPRDRRVEGVLLSSVTVIRTTCASSWLSISVTRSWVIG